MRRLIGGGYLAFSVLLSPALSAGERPEDLATKSAQTWLALVDQGKFGDSWDAAAKIFQKAMTREQWQQALQGVRTPLGKLVSRELKTAEYKSTLPGAPDGSYVVVQYAASFENKKDAVETVTPMLEADGSWKVAGYYIK